MAFRLFPEAQPWWNFADYAALLALVERFRPRTVLEFGPGFSTLALVEGGAESVLAFEDDPRWLAAHRRRYTGLPVELRAYRHADPIELPELDGHRFDFGFVDGPRNTDTRPAAIRFALSRCLVIACHDAHTKPVQEALTNLSRGGGHRFELHPYERNPGEQNALGVIVRV